MDDAAAGAPNGSAPHSSVPIGAVHAAEAAVEGTAGALSLAPSSVVPAIGGELLLPADVGAGTVGTDTVRAAILQAGPLALAGLAANGANVVVTIILARLLASRGYGQLNQLTGLFLIVSMPGSAVIVAVVRRVTAARAQGDVAAVPGWAARVHRSMAMAYVVFAALVLVAGGWLTRAIGQHDTVGVIVILLAGGLWIALSFDRGLLQAAQRYRALASNLVVEGGVRTVCMLTLVGSGTGVRGAALGVLIAEGVTAAHARWMARRAWPFTANADGALRARREVVGDLVTALVALATVALLQNVDVIVVGREASSVSGSYAAVSVASKALVFGALVLGSYLLPEAAIRWRAGHHALRPLMVTLVLLAVPTALLLGLALGAPHFLLRVVFSGRYLGAQSAFALLVGAMAALSVTVILTMYLLAVGRRWISVLLVLGAALLTAVVAGAHGVPATTARDDLFVQLGLAALTTVGFVLVHQRRHRRPALDAPT